LLEAGSKTDVCESKSRQSPLYVAVQHQLVEAVQLLINAGKSFQSYRQGQRRLQKFSDGAKTEILLQYPLQGNYLGI